MGALAELRRQFEEYKRLRQQKDNDQASTVKNLVREEVRRFTANQPQGGSNQALDAIVQELREKGEAQLQSELSAVLKEELPGALRNALADFDIGSWLSDVDLSDVAQNLADPIVKLVSEGGSFRTDLISALTDSVYEDLDLDNIEQAVVDRLTENLNVQVSLNEPS